MGKYDKLGSESLNWQGVSTTTDYILRIICNELAEGNRLRRLELQALHSFAGDELDDKA